MNNLNEAMIDLVKDAYHAEKQLVTAIPKMVKAAHSDELRAAFEDHLEETKGHVERLKEVFAMLEMKPVGKVCPAMKGLIEEGKEVIEEEDGHPAALDAMLIAAAQKIEHYEIASYGTLTSFATTLGLDDVAAIFQSILDEEGAADEKLNNIAEASVNPEAAQAGEEVDEDDEEGASASNSKKTSRRSQSKSA